MEELEFTCTVCPKGCRLKTVKNEKDVVVTGQSCPRGLAFGTTEATDPRRTLTSTVKIINGRLPRLPVRSAKPIPKPLIIPALRLLNELEVSAPVQIGAVIVKNILETGIDIIATRSLDTVNNDQ
ncbi:MAG: DUF1667 domain-containing protein [Bacillota bacterium]